MTLYGRHHRGRTGTGPQNGTCAVCGASYGVDSSAREGERRHESEGGERGEG